MFLQGLVVIISILTSFPQVWSQNCVLVGEKFNLTFNYNPKENIVTWIRNTSTLFSAAVEPSSGSGCQGGNASEGFTFYCEDAGSTYVMEITSNLTDKDDNFTTNPIVGSLVYTPIVDLNQCPKNVCKCNQPGEKIEKFSFSCESTCTQNHFLKLQYQPESGTAEDLENPVNATIEKCHPDADLYKSTFTYIIDSNNVVLNQFNSSTKRVKLIVKMVVGGTKEKVFLTDFFYISSTGTLTTPEPTTSQTSPSSSPVSSTHTSPFSSASSPSQPSFSSSQPGQDTGDSSSTNPVSTDPASTNPSPGTLTSTETIIIIVCCCVGVVILVVLVVCCVVAYIRRRGMSRKRDSIKYNINSVPRYPYHHSPSGEVPRYTNRGYKPWNIYEDGYRYSKPTDRHTQYNTVYNHPRPYRHQREELYMKPDRMYYQPYQYYYY